MLLQLHCAGKGQLGELLNDAKAAGTAAERAAAKGEKGVRGRGRFDPSVKMCCCEEEDAVLFHAFTALGFPA